MQNLTPKVKIFILSAILVIANNIDQNLKVEKLIKFEEIGEM
jgi:hypothetical protein